MIAGCVATLPGDDQLHLRQDSADWKDDGSLSVEFQDADVCVQLAGLAERSDGFDDQRQHDERREQNGLWLRQRWNSDSVDSLRTIRSRRLRSGEPAARDSGAQVYHRVLDPCATGPASANEVEVSRAKSFEPTASTSAESHRSYTVRISMALAIGSAVVVMSNASSHWSINSPSQHSHFG